nr:hypothetical protein [Tanacetum cinerariifolium]
MKCWRCFLEVHVVAAKDEQQRGDQAPWWPRKGFEVLVSYVGCSRVLSSSSVAPYNEATLEDLKTKNPFHPAPSLLHIPIDHHYLVASSTVVLDRIKSFLCGTSCGRDVLRTQHLMDYSSEADVAVSDELISFITQVVNLFLVRNCPQMIDEYIASASLTPCLQFGVRVAGGSEAVLHSVNRLIKASRVDVVLSMLLVDFKNAFNLVDREVMLHKVRLRFPAISRWVKLYYSNPARFITKRTPYGHAKELFRLSLHAWYLEDGTIVGDTMVAGMVLELIMKDGPGCSLHLNVDKTKVFWPKEDSRSRLIGIFPPNIARPLHGVKLLGGPASVDFDFCNELVMKRVAKTIRLMDAIAKINDPQCELLLLRS